MSSYQRDVRESYCFFSAGYTQKDNSIAVKNKRILRDFPRLRDLQVGEEGRSVTDLVENVKITKSLVIAADNWQKYFKKKTGKKLSHLFYNFWWQSYPGCHLAEFFLVRLTVHFEPFSRHNSKSHLDTFYLNV